MTLPYSKRLFAKAKTPDDFNGGGNQSDAVAKFVTVRVLCPALGEDGQTYTQGQEFQTTAARARALGDLVQVLA